jgi:hypothetical protein
MMRSSSGTSPAAAPVSPTRVAVPPPTPLAVVTSMRIDAHSNGVDVNGKAFVCYCVEVTGLAASGGTMQWLVKKRYTEFLDFYYKLCDLSKGVSEVAAYKFPHKSLFHNQDPRTIDRRKSGFLDLLYLAFATQPALLLDFLRVSDPEQCSVWQESPSRQPDGIPLRRASSCSPDVIRMNDSAAAVGAGLESPVSAFNGGGLLEEAAEMGVGVDMETIPEQEELLEPMEFSKAVIRILRVDANDLKKVEFIGDNDPFVTLAFDKWRGRTKTLDNAGQNVSWKLAGDPKFHFDVSIPSLEMQVLRVAAYDDNDLSSATLIGQGSMTLSKVLSTGMDVENSVVVQLTDSKNKPVGKVTVVYDLVQHPDDIAETEKRVQENGLVFALFYIILYEFGLLIYVLVTFDYSTLFDFAMAKLRRELLRLMFCSQLMLILIVLFLYLHRFLGYALTYYLRSKMGTPSGGYAMEFRWLSFRLGLDESEIVLKDFVWKNPPTFTKSPFFVKIKRLCIRFDPNSIYPAIMRNTPIIISDIEINGVTAYVERDPKCGLNIWACMGAADQKTSEASIESSVVGNVSHAMKKIRSSDQGGVKGPKRLLKKQKSTNGGKGMEGDETEEDDEEELLRPAPMERASSVSAKDLNGAAPKTNGFGVPYKFITGRLEIRNLRAYAQDYLNARHTGYSKLTSIRVKRMEMDKKDLCDFSSSKGYRPVWLDDLVWKFIGDIIISLLASNSGSLALLAGNT